MLRALPVLLVIALVVYLVIRFAQRRAGGGGGTPPRGPIAPDDDPSFLRDLDAQLWQQQQEHRAREEPNGEQEPPAS